MSQAPWRQLQQTVVRVSRWRCVAGTTAAVASMHGSLSALVAAGPVAEEAGWMDEGLHNALSALVLWARMGRNRGCVSQILWLMGAWG